MAKPPDDGFLSRWSRRKRTEPPDEAAVDTAEQAVETLDTEETLDTDGGHEGKESPEGEAGDPEVVARLPDIDGMDDSSDFSVFLQAGVPEALRRRALRKLWGVNPVLANLDGLNDYDEDYTQLNVWGRGMKTLYRVGKGFATDEQDAVAEDESRPDATDDPGPEAANLPTPPESESRTAALGPAPGDAESPVQEPAAPTRQSKGTARGRRWGTPENSS